MTRPIVPHCAICGSNRAFFGVGPDHSQQPSLKAEGWFERYKAGLVWYCRTHLPPPPEDKP